VCVCEYATGHGSCASLLYGRESSYFHFCCLNAILLQFVIDKTAHGQVGFAHIELLKCLTHPDLEGVPIVVVFNKELRM
jgi:hypothetical protein